MIANERLRDLRERRADEVVQSLSRFLSTLAEETRGLPPGTIKSPDAPLAYSPQPQPLPEAPVETFLAAERAEFGAAQTGDAISLYRKLTRSPAPAIRAGAWIRLARTFRKLGRREEAIQAYRQLAEVEGAAAGGAPAPLAGQWAVCTMLAETGQPAEIKKEGEALRALLDSGRYSLSRDVYEAYAEDAAGWSGKPRPIVREALADAAFSRPSGSGAARFRGQLITWIQVDNRTELLTEDHAARLLPAGTARVRFATQATGDEALRRAEDTGLPWTLAVALANPAQELKSFDSRRRLLVGLLGLVAAISAGGVYLGWRLIRRELSLARMQADMVAAVSHEFRTPLTSMSQVSAALSEGRVPDEARRQSYYDALARATSRLHRLVENLLDFGRMESGGMPYRMESIDLAALAARVGDDFESETADERFTLRRQIPSADVPVKGDTEALRRALWNLLDNAVKYSGGSAEATVSLLHKGSEAALSVSDHGIGIPPGELRDVFRKFFRGAGARDSRVRGSGIGLSMVDHIVRAHRGRVTVESRVGAGSTFTIFLPMEEQKRNGANTFG